MQYFDTEYFLNNSNHLGEDAVVAAKMKAVENGGTWVLSLLDSQMNRLNYAGEWKPDFNKIETEWVPVVDLQTHQFVGEPNANGEAGVYYTRTYCHPDLYCFIVIHEASYGKVVRSLYMPFRLSDEGVFSKLANQGYFTYEEEAEREKTPTFGMMIKTRHGYAIRYVDVRNPEIDLEGHYGSGFTEVSDEMIRCTSSPNLTGLIIMHGVPGTGKTSYLRWLSSKAARDFVYIPTEIVGQLSSTEFASFLMENSGLTYIVEDAETILMSREDGSTNSHVASILNMTDGIQGDIFNSQFICTFNTALENIDSALLRPGRLLVKHEFKPLDVSDSNALLAKMGKDKVVTEPTTLAVLMNS